MKRLVEVLEASDTSRSRLATIKVKDFRVGSWFANSLINPRGRVTSDGNAC